MEIWAPVSTLVSNMPTQDHVFYNTHGRSYPTYTPNTVHAEGVRLELKTNLDDTATLAWLVSALEQARSQGQTKIVDYLQLVADDVVFEMESAARRRRISSGW